VTDLALPVIVAVACFVVHMVVNRTIAPGPRQRSTQRVALLVSLGTAAACTAAAAWRGGIRDLPFAAVVSGCIAYCYFHLFNMSETARRIRILTSCYLGVPVDERNYSLDAMIDARIERLIMVDSLRLDAGCYRVVPGLLLAAAAFLDWWRGLLFPGRRGPA
jgi:hypothetical protein